MTELRPLAEKAAARVLSIAERVAPAQHRVARLEVVTARLDKQVRHGVPHPLPVCVPCAANANANAGCAVAL